MLRKKGSDPKPYGHPKIVQSLVKIFVQKKLHTEFTFQLLAEP